MTRPETGKPKSKSSASDAATRAWDRAVSLLARRDHSEAEVRSRLAAAGVSASLVAKTVRRLRQRGYLDDHRFALAAAEQAARHGYGSEYLRAQLLAKGVAEALVEEAVQAGFDNETELAGRALARRFAVPPQQPAERARAARFLLRRGFPDAIVFAILDEAC